MIMYSNLIKECYLLYKSGNNFESWLLEKNRFTYDYRSLDMLDSFYDRLENTEFGNLIYFYEPNSWEIRLHDPLL